VRRRRGARAAAAVGQDSLEHFEDELVLEVQMVTTLPDTELSQDEVMTDAWMGSSAGQAAGLMAVPRKVRAPDTVSNANVAGAEGDYGFDPSLCHACATHADAGWPVALQRLDVDSRARQKVLGVFQLKDALLEPRVVESVGGGPRGTPLTTSVPNGTNTAGLASGPTTVAAPTDDAPVVPAEVLDAAVFLEQQPTEPLSQLTRSGSAAAETTRAQEMMVTAAPADAALVAPAAEDALDAVASPTTWSINALGHVSFIQHIFRQTRRRWPGCWRAGGLAALAVYRPVLDPACGHGTQLAPSSAFDAQRARWSRGLAWAKQHTLLLKKFRSGRTPLMLDLFCRAGGASAGAIRAGATTTGMDVEAQPRFEARFGGESFVLGDATDLERLRGLVRRLDPLVIWASPPCQGYSSAPLLGAPSSAEQLIGVIRELLTLLGRPFVIENVVGARSHMREPFMLYGQIFGLHQDRARLFETGGGVLRAACLQQEGISAMVLVLGGGDAFQGTMLSDDASSQEDGACVVMATSGPRRGRARRVVMWWIMLCLWASIRATCRTQTWHRQCRPTTPPS
jgi:hypothetical protein